VFKCDYLFKSKLEFKNTVLREIFGGKVERLAKDGENCNGL
jgi:hypothetical protein